jgi:hypothetical protein
MTKGCLLPFPWSPRPLPDSSRTLSTRQLMVHLCLFPPLVYLIITREATWPWARTSTASLPTTLGAGSSPPCPHPTQAAMSHLMRRFSITRAGSYTNLMIRGTKLLRITLSGCGGLRRMSVSSVLKIPLELWGFRSCSAFGALQPGVRGECGACVWACKERRGAVLRFNVACDRFAGLEEWDLFPLPIVVGKTFS